MVTVNCKGCGLVFEAKTKRRTYCDDCLRERRKEQGKALYHKNLEKRREYNREYWRCKRSISRSKSGFKGKPKNPLDVILWELDEYNRQNGCLLSYGEFVSKFKK